MALRELLELRNRIVNQVALEQNDQSHLIEEKTKLAETLSQEVEMLREEKKSSDRQA